MKRHIITYLRTNPIQPLALLIVLAGLLMNYILNGTVMVLPAYLIIHFGLYILMFGFAYLVEVDGEGFGLNIFAYDPVRNSLLVIAHPIALISMVGIFVFSYLSMTSYHYLSLAAFIYSSSILSFYYELIVTNKSASFSGMTTARGERIETYYKNKK